jgi:hypothetical protein
MWGRSFVPEEARDEFSHPTYWSSRHDRESDDDDETPRERLTPSSEHAGVKLLIMAVVMIAILLALIAIFA